MFGNQAVKDLTGEVNRRLSLCDAQTGVGEVLYGLTHDKAQDIERLTGSRWVDLGSTSDFGDADQLLFTSDTTPEKLENHLVWFYSKIDPDVVLCNQYDSEDGSYVGVRFKIVRKGKIFSFHRHKENSSTIADEFEKNEDEISWDDLWEMQDDLYRKSRAELVAEFSFADLYIRKK